MDREPLLQPGQLLEGRYRLGPLLARGGFGEVYEAYDLQLERRVALKYIFQPLDAAQLQNEVRILAAHAERLRFMPNVYGFWQGARGAGFYIVMEFVEGPTLRESRPLPWAAARVSDFLRVLLGNLADLHRHGIIHCDIKPVNIKATPDDKLSISVPYRLLDFGIARQSGQTVISGASPHYSAPEQHGLGAVRIDHRVDLYALGATAYFLLTGLKPADSRRRYAAVSRGDRDELRPPGELVPDLLPGLVATLLDLLQLDRERRPPDAAAALALLEQRLAPPPAPPTSKPPPVADATRLDHEQPASGVSIAPATLLTTASSSPGLASPSSPPASLVAVSRPARSPEPALRTPPPLPAPPQATPRRATLLDRQGNGRITGVAWASDGEALLIATTLGIYRYSVESATCAPWRPTASPVQQIGVTGDGTAVFSSDDQLLLLPNDSPEPVASGLQLNGGQLLSAARSPTVAIVGDDLLRLVDLSGQLDELVLPLPPQLVGRPVALAADGRAVAYGAADQIAFFSLLGEHQQIAGLPQPLHAIAISANSAALAVACLDAVAVWQAGDAAAQLFAHAGATRVALSGEGDLLAVASATGVSLRLSYNGRPLPELAEADLAGASFLAFCPRDRLLAAATPTELRIWRLADRSLVVRLDSFGAVGPWLAPLGGQAFVSAGNDLCRWAVEQDRLMLERALPLEQPAAGVAGGGPWLACAEEYAVVLRACDSLAVAGTRPMAPAQHHGLALSPDGGRLIVAGATAVFVGATGEPEATHQIPLAESGEAEHVVFSANGERVAIHSRGLITVRALADGAEICAVRPRLPGEISALALSPDGTQLVAALGGVLACWELDEGRARLRWQQAFDGRPAHSLSFVADGACIVALQGAQLYVWRLNEAGIEPQPSVCDHNDLVTDALLLDGGRMLISTSADGALRLWALD